MKKILALFLIVLLLLTITGCVQKDVKSYIVATYERTPDEQIEEYQKNSKDIILNTYYEMSDGTWKTDEYTYKYKLEITGRLNNAASDSKYVILSNTKNITFEQAWKASGLSSNTEDYFKPEDAVFVSIS